MKGIPWYLLTEKQIPKTVTKNIAWLYPAQLMLDEVENTLSMAGVYLNFFVKEPTLLIPQVAMMLDQAYSLLPGESLKNIRSLLALRVFLFDIRKPWSTLTVKELQASSDIHSLGIPLRIWPHTSPNKAQLRKRFGTNVWLLLIP